MIPAKGADTFHNPVDIIRIKDYHKINLYIIIYLQGGIVNV